MIDGKKPTNDLKGNYVVRPKALTPCAVQCNYPNSTYGFYSCYHIPVNEYHYAVAYWRVKEYKR